MKSLWLVVANHTQARIFTAASPTFSELSEIEDLNYLPSRLHDREITSDLPGKIKNMTAGGHAYEQPTDPKKHEADNFAHLLAKHLESARNANTFSHLALIAEPAFLGLLRQCLSEQLKKSICFELDANLAKSSIEEIRRHLPAFIPS